MKYLGSVEPATVDISFAYNPHCRRMMQRYPIYLLVTLVNHERRSPRMISDHVNKSYDILRASHNFIVFNQQRCTSTRRHSAIFLQRNNHIKLYLSGILNFDNPYEL